MNVFRLLRFFLPLQNPLGFGLTDYVEFVVAGLLVAALLTRGRWETALRALAERPRLAAAVLFTLPVALRLMLLGHHPIPIPQVGDDFAYLLLGDTLAHLRLANPVHPMHRFFETIFVLQEPSYSSIYPLGQGIALALGQVLFGLPWAGVAASVGAMCAGVYWMLRGWVRPQWALAGGLLAVMQFGPLNQWMNNYWGGAVSALAGCLVFGAAARLLDGGRRRDAALLGLGLGLQMVTRPFESVLLDLCIAPLLFRRRIPLRLAGIAALAALPFAGLTLLQNKAVTRHWTSLPYMLSRYQYGVPAAFTFEPMPVPHRALTHDQALDYEAQKQVHGDNEESAAEYLGRLAGRVRFIRFFYYAPLYAALPFFIRATRRRRMRWAAGSILLFLLGTNFYPYYYPHYIAAATCLFVLTAVVSLERLGSVRIRGFEVGRPAMRILALLCLVQFAFWYGLHVLGNEDLFMTAGPYESWDYVNFGDTEGRLAIGQRLAAAPGKQLVFVRYGGQHFLREWIGNKADIDSSRVVWALDLGEAEDGLLRGYYPDRTAWLVEPDARPPRLNRYP